MASSICMKHRRREGCAARGEHLDGGIEKHMPLMARAGHSIVSGLFDERRQRSQPASPVKRDERQHLCESIKKHGATRGDLFVISGPCSVFMRVVHSSAKSAMSLVLLRH